MATKRRKPRLSENEKKYMNYLGDQIAMFATNNEQLYRQGVYIATNLASKKAKGAYKKDLAIKAYRHLADPAAKKLLRWETGKNLPGYGKFIVPAREEAAKILLDIYSMDIDDFTHDLRAGMKLKQIRQDRGF